MPKFFIRDNQIEEEKIKIYGQDVNHIKNVFRKTIGDTIKVCNEDTKDNYLAKIVEINQNKVEAVILEKFKSNSEPGIFIHVFQGLPKADKMELIIQKSVELGVSKITPVSMRRCIVKIAPKDQMKKIQRWQKISEAASKQCGRNIVPIIDNVIKVKDICEFAKDYDSILVAYENEENNKLKCELQRLKNNKSNNLKIAIVIGPEGGLADEDVNYLKENGAKSITLGKRILRTETVALNIISIINYEFED